MNKRGEVMDDSPNPVTYHLIANGKVKKLEAGYWADGDYFRENLGVESALTAYHMRQLERDLEEEAQELNLLRKAA